MCVYLFIMHIIDGLMIGQYFLLLLLNGGYNKHIQNAHTHTTIPPYHVVEKFSPTKKIYAWKISKITNWTLYIYLMMMIEKKRKIEEKRPVTIWPSVWWSLRSINNDNDNDKTWYWKKKIFFLWVNERVRFGTIRSSSFNDDDDDVIYLALKHTKKKR